MKYKIMKECVVVAVVLLILGSLSTVVGYQTVKPTINDSPLFTTRTQKATNQQQSIITSKYLGKGMYALTFPLRDDKTEQLKRVTERIQRMDDKTFTWFTTFCVQRVRQYDALIDMNTNTIMQILHLFRTYPGNINSLLHMSIQNSYSTSPWRPGCLIEGFSDLFYALLIFILFLYIAIFVPDFTLDCGSPT